MTGTGRIPLKESTGDPCGLGPGVNAILSEIAAMLEALLASGCGGQIDMKSLPLSAAEHSRLKDVLGEGEVTIELALNGATRCRETAVAGVWWVEHRDASGSVVAEFIEVARVPEILNYDDDELRNGVTTLGRQLGRL